MANSGPVSFCRFARITRVTAAFVGGGAGKRVFCALALPGTIRVITAEYDRIP